MPKVAEEKGANKTDSIVKYAKANPDATAKQIVDGLAKEGVEVSISLVNQRRPDRGSKKRGRPAKAAKGAKVAKTPKARRASKSGQRGEKSLAIREEFEKLGLKTAPVDVINNLAARGIKVSSAQVSQLRKKLRKESRLARKMAKGGAAPVRAKGGDGMIDIDHLLKARQLVSQLGSIDAVREALEALVRLN